MPMKRTAVQLLEEIRQRSGVSTTHMKDPALLTIINAGWGVLWEVISTANPKRLMTEEAIDIVDGTYKYQLGYVDPGGEQSPYSSYYMSLGFDIVDEQGDRCPMVRMEHFDDREYHEDATSRHDVQYMIVGDYVWLSPKPNWDETDGLIHYYIPSSPQMATSGTGGVVTEVDHVPNEWFEFIRLYALLELADYMQKSTGALMARLEAHRQRISRNCQPSDALHPVRVSKPGARARRRRYPRFGTS